MRTRSLLLATLSAAVLAACASSAGLAPHAKLDRAERLSAKSIAASAEKTDAAWPAADWWRTFGDDELDRLIEEALAGNPNLRVARARLERAVALAGVAEAARAPRVDANGAITDQRFSESGLVPPPFAGSWHTTNQFTLDFGYELDFWGKNAAALRAALGEARAAQAEEAQARLLLAAALARGYAELQGDFDALDIARAALAQRESLHELTQRRVRAGLDSNVELEQAAAAIPAAQADIAAIEQRIALHRNLLAALAGAGPDRGAAIGRPKLAAPAALSLPSALPAELIGRRPDIVAARWRAEAAARNIDVAKARFYPNVNLAAFVGLQSVGLSHFLEGGSVVAGAGPALSLPIFDAGRLRSELAARDADYDAAAETYNAALVEAVRDVADQVAAWRGIDAQLAQGKAALARFEEAYRLAVLRYREGLSTYLTVLTAEGQVLGERRQIAELEARRRETAVALARALGGGFQPDTPDAPGA